MLREKLEASLEINTMMTYDPDRKVYVCKCCAFTNAKENILFNHIDCKHYSGRYNCQFCGKICPTQYNLKKHIRMSHITALFCSKGCGSKFKNVEPLERHESVCDFKAPTPSGMTSQSQSQTTGQRPLRVKSERVAQSASKKV